MNWTTLRRRLGKAHRLSLGQWTDLFRASVELARARIVLYGTDPRSLVTKNASEPIDIPSKLVDRVAFAVPAAAAIVPWRSDCLVQALAAQRWLAGAGIVTRIHLGVANADGFLAHAWLTHGARVVTGGEISQFVPFSAGE